MQNIIKYCLLIKPFTGSLKTALICNIINIHFSTKRFSFLFTESFAFFFWTRHKLHNFVHHKNSSNALLIIQYRACTFCLKINRIFPGSAALTGRVYGCTRKVERALFALGTKNSRFNDIMASARKTHYQIAVTQAPENEFDPPCISEKSFGPGA